MIRGLEGCFKFEDPSPGGLRVDLEKKLFVRIFLVGGFGGGGLGGSRNDTTPGPFGGTSVDNRMSVIK